MTPNDFRILCTALGFTIALLKDVELDEQALRAQAIARLIESFCQVTVPECFEESRKAAARHKSSRKLALANRMATVIARIIKETGGCVPSDLLEKGFAAEEIDRHWPMASALVAVKLNLKPKDS